jgi:hypothetical protein
VPGLCPPRPTTLQPTPYPTPAPTPPPTPYPTTPRPPEIFPNCIQPRPEFRILWRIDGTASNSDVRIKFESPTTGWAGIGFVNGTCTPGTMAMCMRGANIVTVSRSAGEPDWRIGIAVGPARDNGMPEQMQHGVVTGLAGRVEAFGPPAVSRPHIHFARKVQAGLNFVPLRVAGTDTKQTIIYAWGKDGEEAMTFHEDRRGAVVVDWSKQIEECGREPMTAAPTPPPTMGAYDCDVRCGMPSTVGSDRWCECCQHDCFDAQAACVKDNEFCLPMGQCERNDYCAASRTTTTNKQTTVAVPVVAEPSGDFTTIGIAVGAIVGFLVLVGLVVGIVCFVRRRSKEDEAISGRPELNSVGYASTLPPPSVVAQLPPDVEKEFFTPMRSPRHRSPRPDFERGRTETLAALPPVLLPPSNLPQAPPLGTRGRTDTLASLPPPPALNYGAAPPLSTSSNYGAVPPFDNTTATSDYGAPPTLSDGNGSKESMRGHSRRKLPPARTDTLASLPPPVALSALPPHLAAKAPPMRTETLQGLPPVIPSNTLSRVSTVVAPPPGVMPLLGGSGGLGMSGPAMGGTVRGRPPPPGTEQAPGTLRRVKPPPPPDMATSPVLDSVSPRPPVSPTGRSRPPPPPGADLASLRVNLSSGLLAMPAGANAAVNNLPPPPVFNSLPRHRGLGEPPRPPPPQ